MVRLVARLAKQEPRRLLLALILMAVLAAADGIGAAVLILLLQALGIDMQAGGAGRLSRALTSVLHGIGLASTLVPTLSIYVATLCSFALLSRWQSVVNFRIQANFVAGLRERLYRAITYTSWAFYSRKRSADFAHALSVEANRVGQAIQYLLQLIGTSLLALAYLALAMLLSWQATIAVIGSGLVLIGALWPLVRVSRRFGRAFSDASTELHAAAAEHLSGMKLVRGYHSQERDIERFAWLANRLSELVVGTIRKQSTVKASFDIGTALILAAILLAGHAVLNLPAGTLLILLFLCARLVPRLSSLQQQYQLVASTLPALEAVDRIQAECEAAAEFLAGRATTIELHGEIRLEHLSYSYQASDDSPAVADLSLVIPAAQTTALVGPSGAGKSTIGDLIMGLLTPTSGSVRVDGIPLGQDRLASWRGQLGYVEQETFLFHDTVRANLLWANPAASSEQLGEALRLAAADEFVRRLPQGLETIAGDRGVRLSGGQRQRLALARALLRQPSVLILDEATSDLDYESEQRIWEAIDALHRRITILVITHRLALVQHADLIHVIDDGRLVESGDWHSLTAVGSGRLLTLWQAAGRP